MVDKRLIETFEKNREVYRKHFENLLSINTETLGHGILGGREKEGQEYILNLLKEMNADEIIIDQMTEEDIQYSIENYKEGNPGHNYDDRFNVFGIFKGKGDRSIGFNGHMDTMPPGNLDNWKTDPFKPTYIGNKLYGLGATDMKSGLMASIMAVKLLQDAGIELPGDVLISSVADEEGGGNGTISAVVNDRVADAMVVCEPSENAIITAHMGFVFFEISVTGKALHSGYKWKGVNAIEKAIKIIEGLNELEHEWLMEYKHPLLPPPTLNIGVIEGGTAGSTVPDHCTFKICVHYLPKLMDHDGVVESVLKRIDVVSDGDEWLKTNKPEVNIYQAGGAFEQDVEHDFVKTAKKALENYQEEVNIIGGAAGNDARLYSNISKVPTIIMGPGFSEQCHMPNEFVDIDSYDRHILAYAKLILDWTNK